MPLCWMPNADGLPSTVGMSLFRLLVWRHQLWLCVQRSYEVYGPERSWKHSLVFLIIAFSMSMPEPRHLDLQMFHKLNQLLPKWNVTFFFCRWWMLMRTKWGLLSPERPGRKWEGQWAGHQNIRSKRPLKDDKETQRQMKASAYFLYLLLENKRRKSFLLKTILKSEQLERSNYTHFPCHLMLDHLYQLSSFWIPNLEKEP